MDAETRDLVLLHGAFGVVALGVLLPGQGQLGWRLAGLVVLYHVATLVVTTVRDHRRWRHRWWFGAALSLAMVLPDAFLVEGLGTLTFPADGFPDIGPVTGYMAGLWTIPTVLIVTVADEVGYRRGERASWLAALGTTAVVFTAAEVTLTRLPIWEPVDVTTLGSLALYILPAELVLGGLMLAGARWTRTAHPLAVFPVGVLVALAYTGAAAGSWLLLERGLFG